jgi:glutathione S-transferase
MPRWTLYTAPGTCALATHVALREAGADFDLARLDFGASEQRSAHYLALNPKGRVPALVTEDGVLTETPALLLFVAQRFPAARLAPLDDAFALAQMQAWTGWLSSTMHVAHAHKFRGARWADDPAAHAAMRAKVPQTMADCAAFVESRLASPYLLGDGYSVADAHLYTIASWLEGDGVDMAPFPRLVAHRERVGARPAVQRALAESKG